jgi:ParB/RepB/Spo0J family partition protein
MDPSESLLFEEVSRDRWAVVEVEVALVDPPAEEVRFGLSEERVEELEGLIRKEGLLQFPGVRRKGERFLLVWGKHRLEAVKRLGWLRMPARLVEVDDDQAVLLGGIENLAREQMSPVEEAALCGRLLEVGGGDVDVLARRLKRSRGWVESRLRMLSWPADIQKGVHDGSLSAAAGSELALISDDGHRAFLVSHAAGGGATARTCQAWRIAWEQTGVVDSSSVAQVAPGRTVPPPVEAELPCYFCGDRELYGRLTHVWLCPEALDLFVSFREAFYGRAVVPVDGGEGGPEVPGGGLRPAG